MRREGIGTIQIMSEMRMMKEVIWTERSMKTMRDTGMQMPEEGKIQLKNSSGPCANQEEGGSKLTCQLVSVGRPVSDMRHGVRLGRGAARSGRG